VKLPSLLPMFAGVLFGLFCVPCAMAQEKSDAATKVDPDHVAKMAKGIELFKKHVGPIFVARCIKCHGGEATESEFDLTVREKLLKGGASGAAIVLGKSQESRLYKLVAHLEEPYMPEDGAKLAATDLAAIAAWIELGAPYDRSLLKKDEESDWTKTVIDASRRDFWSYLPLRRVQPPPSLDPNWKNWARTPIDAFIQQKAHEKGVSLQPLADRRTLLRRAYFDLIGLPPTAEETNKFLSDNDPDAYSKLIDRLLESPHYGERWGRHWLDIARFGESHGFEQDYDRPFAYHYRDFVIKALNVDMPYDQFVRWQLAGDEIEPDNPLALMATGFLGAGVFPTQLTEKEFEPARYDELDDMVSTLGTSMLGLTIGCARCHDHKFDPIPAADYYRMAATFATAIRSEIELDLDPENFRQATQKWEAEHQPFLSARLTYEASINERAFSSWVFGWLGLQSKVVQHEAKKPKLPKVMVVTEGMKPIPHHADDRGFPHFYPDVHFLKRGDAQQKSGVAQVGYLQVLNTSPAAAEAWKVTQPAETRTSQRRRALAAWVTDTQHGAGHLLARVIVNRMWHHHFGRGIVATPSDFGYQGLRPDHPELLEWLAAQLIQNDWRLKPIHKLMMTSGVYMQGSAFDEASFKIDPENTCCWRFAPRRLEAEIIRDSMLAVSGELDRTPFGPGSLDDRMKRRSIYFMVKRSKLIPMMQLFDSPEPLAGVGDRPSTTIAPQSLMFLNSPQVRGYARRFASHLLEKTGGVNDELIRLSYVSAIAREPSEIEMKSAKEFLQRQQTSYQTDKPSSADTLAVADWCQVLFALNEFIYVE
jgi:hypothetical protein